MRYREYRMPISYYHISILNGHPELTYPERYLIPGAKIKFSIPEPTEYPYNNRGVTTLEEYVDEYIENDESYIGIGTNEYYEEETRFFSEHYREIFCGKYPEWIVYDIDALCYASGFCIAFANTKTNCECQCHLISNEKGGGELQVEVYNGVLLTERYLLRKRSVVEFIGQIRRKYEFEEEENGQLMATIEEYAYALL